MARDKAAELDWMERRARIRRAKRRRDIPYLIGALEDPAHGISDARILSRLGAAEAIDPLIHELERQDHNRRIFATKALGDLGATETAPRLRELARHDERGSVRAWAASVLVDWRDPEALDLNVRLLQSSDVNVRGHAAHSLARLAEPAALGPLRNARPKISRAPFERRLWGHAYRRAIAASRRAAAGKTRRELLERWLPRAARVLVVAVAISVLWAYAGFWWALLPVAVVLLDWAVIMVWTVRNVPLD
jgi:HEAT repeat protein